MKINKGTLLTFLIVGIGTFACGQKTGDSLDSSNLKVGTASKEGFYYALGQSMTDIVNSSEKELQVELVSTNGSVDNIEKLSNGELDLAIVQNDIAFFAENGLAPFNTKVENLRGVLSFYSEPIYIVTNDPSINYLHQLRDKRVNTGPEGSGLFIDVRIILNSVDLWSVVTKESMLPVDGADAVMAGEIDAAFTNALLDRHKEAIAFGNLKLVPIRSSTISMISNTYPYFERFDTNEFEVNETTIAVRATLVAREDLGDSEIYHLTKQLHENYLDLSFPIPHNTDVANQVTSSMSLRSYHGGARSYFEDVGVMKSQNLLRLFGTISFVLLLILSMVILFHVFSGGKNRTLFGREIGIINPIQKMYGFIIRHKYIMVLVFMLSSYATIIMLVQTIEHQWAIENNVVSNFDNRSFGSNLLWMFVFGGSGYIDNLFPNSPISKFLVALIRLIGIGGFLAIVGLFTSDQIRNRILKARGGKRAMIKDHIIVCGWNENIPYLVQNLLLKYNGNEKAIVILADPSVEEPLQYYNIDSERVNFVRGTAKKTNDLDRAGILHAEIAVIIPDTSFEEPDDRTLMLVHSIESYCKKLEESKKRVGRENIYTIAELTNKDSYELAETTELDEIISYEHIKTKMLVESVVNPGVSGYFNEILDPNNENKFFSMTIDEKSPFLNKTYDELLVTLRKNTIGLKAISIGNHKSRQEKNEHMKKYNLTKPVIINPFREDEINYKTQLEDVLVVLAEDEKLLKDM